MFLKRAGRQILIRSVFKLDWLFGHESSYCWREGFTILRSRETTATVEVVRKSRAFGILKLPMNRRTIFVFLDDQADPRDKTNEWSTIGFADDSTTIAPFEGGGRF
jgi:hypothetical protein